MSRRQRMERDEQIPVAPDVVPDRDRDRRNGGGSRGAGVLAASGARMLAQGDHDQQRRGAADRPLWRRRHLLLRQNGPAIRRLPHPPRGGQRDAAHRSGRADAEPAAGLPLRPGQLLRTMSRATPGSPSSTGGRSTAGAWRPPFRKPRTRVSRSCSTTSTSPAGSTPWVPSVSDLHVLVQLCALEEDLQAHPLDPPLAVNMSFGRRTMGAPPAHRPGPA